MLVAAGSDMPTCLRLSASATGSERALKEGDVVANQVEQGTNVIEAGQYCSTIPRFFLYSVQLGSQRNELQDNLYSLGQMYNEQSRTIQAKLQVLLLPIMIIIVGVVIGMMVLAMFLPLVNMMQVLT